jgi:hypothetical protein
MCLCICIEENSMASKCVCKSNTYITRKMRLSNTSFDVYVHLQIHVVFFSSGGKLATGVVYCRLCITSIQHFQSTLTLHCFSDWMVNPSNLLQPVSVRCPATRVVRRFVVEKPLPTLHLLQGRTKLVLIFIWKALKYMYFSSILHCINTALEWNAIYMHVYVHI